ncbi:assimilatory sulfite reductase (NADPH) flavoprotein subunit [Lysinibacillus sp. fkY74-1]|uniref:assimilatory sulfite reductase (NADPH) flavoprotein subunit n=1 Tax=Lysinibacillus TaxID=400634 RepID=UPI0018CEA178|nr:MULTISPECIES: assimilatory sulfite reductase (NADPH) flavoprotein subunit [Lysinibacillus]MBG9757209.1 sulfite reductase [NADPH] flavoprotein alpha-component [Lysinibacillus sphaericus]MBI6862857.1 assimilatory sulfite reductase (NADPH) flavoprotein subunit [Lysinibacillus fusiformis]QPA53689.1 assimilatory sulfite reductase (NADPH) flavoprotein subunit [Lysinibacillus sphaericus]QTB12857.1 assimilatory sulfite reductase (NADPH) flavoprotein subunit [Lysinibacillus sphaericus]QTB26216.1 ass
MKLQVINSPFNEEQVKLLNELLPQLTLEQKIWLNGYLSAAQATQEPIVVTAPATTQSITKTMTILYGSQTGNSQGLAEKYASLLEAQNVDVTVSSLGKFKASNLKKITNLLLIVSTHGEGDPPDQAIQFYEFLHSKRAPKLEHLQYSVLALGDSSYEFFCKTGKDFDEQFAKLGATRMVPRTDCDVDYDDAAAQWFSAVQQEFLKQATAISVTSTESDEILGATTYSRKNPFYAEVLENINLNGRGSNKETRHLELSIEGANFQFEPGDSIGIQPENSESLVDALLVALQFDPATEVTVFDEILSLKNALQKRLEITVLSKPVLEKIKAYTEHNEFSRLLEEPNAWKDYAKGRDLLDVVEDFAPFTWSAQQFVDILRKIPSRLYSIASSQLANNDEVHLTISKVSYETNGRQRLGVCSGSVADLQIGDTLPIYVHKNPNFRLPEQKETPIIMIGAGTGIAPYRAFLEEREELGVVGKAWLIFGDQHFVTDFLYQTDWQRWLASGTLSQMHIAFSRDTDKKIYVQHKIEENAANFYEWLEQGAVIYVCGDEKSMAADVDATIHRIIEQQGQKSSEQAKTFVQELKQQKRYQRDVY